VLEEVDHVCKVSAMLELSETIHALLAINYSLLAPDGLC